MAGPRTFSFLGTGTSVGVPMVGCDCDVCRSTNPRNQRFRCSVLVGTPQGNILIDTPPELRLQLLRENVKLISKDTYGAGWLYLVEGKPDPNCVDVEAYRDILDKTIDRMLEKQKLSK